jgi:hypothetical protein
MAPAEPLPDDPRVKIQVLLAEYATLRQEIVSRTGTRFALLGLLLGLSTFVVVPREGVAIFQYTVGVLVLFILLLVWWRLAWLIKQCTRRVAEIERKINGIVGEELLVWESRIASNFLFHRVVATLDRLLHRVLTALHRLFRIRDAGDRK